MLLRRRVSQFKLDLCWDGKAVRVAYDGERNMDFVGEARGVRTASALMDSEIEAMHETCQALTSDLL